MGFKKYLSQEIAQFSSKSAEKCQKWPFFTVCGIREARENAYGRSGFANIEVKIVQNIIKYIKLHEYTMPF